MKEIQLTQGKVALVDDEDFEALSAHKWYAHRAEHTFYAGRNVPSQAGGQKTVKMHRAILSRKLGRPIAKGMECDHDNGNGLDNRRENLFEVTKAQNQRNCHRKYRRSPSSQFLGVSWHKASSKWLARIGIARKRINLGIFVTAFDAAVAREAYIRMHPELNARANFPQEGASR